MKRIYILLIAVFSLGMGGCNYVDVDPVGKVIPDEVSEYRALLTTAYSTYPQYRRYLMVRSDEVFPDLYGLSYDNYIDLATLNDENPDPLTETYPWTAMYNMIFYANTVIEGVMEARADVTTDSREQLLAEAYCLRAFVHFDLINLYAKWYDPATAATDKAVPLSLKIDIGQSFIPTTVEKVYEQVFADLQEAEKYMQVEQQTGAYLYLVFEESAESLPGQGISLSSGLETGSGDSRKSAGGLSAGGSDDYRSPTLDLYVERSDTCFGNGIQYRNERRYVRIG